MTFCAGLRVQRELRAAALARRGGARQGLAARARCRATAGRSSRTCAPTTASCSATRARSCCSWAREFAQEARVEPRPQPRLAPARRPEHARRAAAGARPEPAASRDRRRCTNATSRPTASSGSTTATPSARCWLRAARPQRRAASSSWSATSRRCRTRSYRIGVPRPGVYRERINTDSTHYGGSNVGTPYGEVTAEAMPWHGRPQSIVLDLAAAGHRLLRMEGCERARCSAGRGRSARTPTGRA